MSEERGFEVIDKRRVHAEGAAESQEAPQAGPSTTSEPETPRTEPTAEPEARAEPGAAEGERTVGPEAGGPLPEMDAVGVVSLCVNMLHEVAWVKMGLVPSPMTQQIERDLAQARLAIDCAADLVRHLEPRVDATMRRDLQNLISTLRLTYVQQSQR